MQSEYKCNLLVPGAAKSGTSSLSLMLGNHPDICMTNPKEPQFFSFDERFKRGAEGHNAYFENEGDFSVYCDASQSYFIHEHAMRRAKECLADPKVIILLRHPVDRIRSQYNWAVRSGMENADFREAVFGKGHLTSYHFVPEINAYWPDGGYLEFSSYRKYCDLWLKFFGPDRVKILRAEDLFGNTEAVMAEIFEFLGIDNLSGIAAAKSNESSKTRLKVPPRKLSGLASILPRGLKQTGVYKALKNRSLRAVSPTAVIDEKVIQELQGALESDIEFYQNI